MWYDAGIRKKKRRSARFFAQKKEKHGESRIFYMKYLLQT